MNKSSEYDRNVAKWVRSPQTQMPSHTFDELDPAPVILFQFAIKVVCDTNGLPEIGDVCLIDFFEEKFVFSRTQFAPLYETDFIVEYSFSEEAILWTYPEVVIYLLQT